MIRLRSNHDGPWCWQSKAARRCIREAFDATNNVATALAVYDALCEIASDSTKSREQEREFTTTHDWIRHMSGVSIRTIQNHLKVFAELGLVAVATPKRRAPSTYRLLSFGNGCGSIGNGCRTFGNGSEQPSLPTSEEHQKNLQKNDEEPSCGAVTKTVEPKLSRPRDPILAVVDAWNAHSQLPACRSLTSRRKKIIRARLADAYWCDNYTTAIAKIAASPFCLGENDRGWRADFDFFIKPDTVVNAMEGKYDPRHQHAAAADSRTIRYIQ